jgi:hypothetical protein
MDAILLTIVFIGAPIALGIGIPMYAYMCAKDNENKKNR